MRTEESVSHSGIMSSTLDITQEALDSVGAGHTAEFCELVTVMFNQLAGTLKFAVISSG